MKVLIKEMAKILFFRVIYPIFKIFPTSPNKIIYISHYGNRFACNPKSMFEYIRKEKEGYEHVIVSNGGADDLQEDFPDVKIVSYQSLAFLKELASSKYWVVNANLPAALKPKEDTVYLQTWHGAGAFKKFGMDLPSHREKEKKEWMTDTSHWTKMLCSSESIRGIYAQACKIDERKIFPTGLPRNDVFYDEQHIQKVQQDFKKNNKIPADKKVILYAPTYRDDVTKNDLQFDFEKLQEALGQDYVFLLKLHPLVAEKAKGIADNDFLRNFSDYPDIQDLLLITDLLITDYSSVIFDFAITGKPILFYAYDLKEYDQEMRGFYYPYQEWVPGPIVYAQNEIEKCLANYDDLYQANKEKVLAFANEYNANHTGTSTQRAVELLLDEK